MRILIGIALLMVVATAATLCECAESDKMQIVVGFASSKNIILDVDPTDTVGAVKDKIVRKLDLQGHFCGFDLWFGSQQLDVERTLSDYNIQNESTIQLLHHRGCHSEVRPGDSTKIRLFVKTVSGKSIIVEVKPSDTVDAVKAKIADKEGIPVDRYNLWFGNNLLDAEHSLSYYDIQDKSTIQLLFHRDFHSEVRPEDSTRIRLFVKTVSGKFIKVEVKPSDTVDAVKAQIAEKEGIPVNQYNLWFGNNLLDAEHSLSYYDIQDKSNIKLLFHR